MAEKLKIGVIGTGNVATNLLHNLERVANVEVYLYGRNKLRSQILAKNYTLREVESIVKIENNCSLVILCVRDDEIQKVGSNFINFDGSVLHTSGAMDIDILSNQGIKRCGVLYPLQSLSSENPISFEKVPICLESNNLKTLTTMRNLAESFANTVVDTDSESRAYLHLAAVFANNFTNQLYAIASEIVEKRNLSFDMLRPLIAHTAERVMDNDPESQQTGPAIRNDYKTIHKHRELLSEPDLVKIYDEFTRRIQKLKTNNIER